ncbi:hypothetical protein TWF694_002650 [Orbilia ellipsospora]|uniref:Uncharacterized protein n=1 Tax=Orbilia ellipsospora TaxID=2528407 RepID=A0AAV9X2X7_9PEZI
MAENIPTTPFQKTVKQKSLIEDAESSVGIIQGLDRRPKSTVLKDLTMGNICSTSTAPGPRNRVSQSLKDQIEGDTAQLFQQKLAINTLDKTANDPKLSKPGQS